MNIEAKDFEIKMSYGELWSVAFDIQYAIENALRTHWVNHQDSWQNGEKDRLSRSRAMFIALGRPDLNDLIIGKAKEIFDEFNKAKK